MIIKIHSNATVAYFPHIHFKNSIIAYHFASFVLYLREYFSGGDLTFLYFLCFYETKINLHCDRLVRRL